MTRSGRNERGVALAEVAIAVAIVMVSLVAMIQVMPVAVMSTARGNQVSTATFLAEQKMEEIKAWAASTCGTCTPARGFDTVVTGNPCCPDEGYGGITGYSTYRRTVTVTDNPDGITGTKRVEVTVFYRPLTATGVSAGESSVRLSTLLGR